MTISTKQQLVDSGTDDIVAPGTRPKPRGGWIPKALVLPAFITAFILTQVPFLATVYYSFQHWDLLRPETQAFAGFENYVTVLTTGDFMASLWSSVLITGTSVLLAVVLGLLIALLLNRTFRGLGFARTLLITPFLMMPAAAALIWKWTIFDANAGILNWALGLVGIPPVAWNTDFPVFTIITVLTWQYTPFMMLIILAGLQSQSGEVLEAAQVDGAGAFRTFQAITLPHLRPYIELAALLGSIFMLQVFDPVHIMTKGTGGTKTLPYLLYERAFIGLNIGEAAAYGVITVIVTMIVATFALRMLFKIFSAEGAR
ncbi:carbohydrate ABC transporter permease [Microbacterium sp. C23T]